MRRLIWLGMLAILSVACAAQIPSRPEGLGEQRVSLHLPPVQRWELPNGLVVHYLHDPELPVMQGALMVPGGSFFDSPESPGLAALTGGLMREGSVEGIAPDALDARLDALGAGIESSFGDEFGTVKFSCLSADFDEVFSLFSRVVRKPAFDPARVALTKKLSMEGIARRRDDPNTMAGMIFSLALFGPHSSYSQWITPPVLAAVGPADFRRFHTTYVRPDYAYLSLTGSLSRDEVAQAIEKQFGSWTRTGAPRPAVPKPPAAPKPAIYVLKRDFVQSSILMGHIGPPRKMPDQYAMTVFNRIFGQGGFGTVLLSEIRTKLGYVYSIYGGLFPGAVSGSFQIDLQSRNETAIAAVKRVRELIQESTEKQPLEAQMKEAKDTVARSFVFKFEGSEALVSRQTLLEFWGYPPDFDETYLERVASVSKEDVLKVAKRWIAPPNVVVVMVGGVDPQDVANAFGTTAEVYTVSFDFEPHIGERVVPTT